MFSIMMKNNHKVELKISGRVGMCRGDLCPNKVT